jgi:cytoskeletal protein CcmA (bactofilin family)
MIRTRPDPRRTLKTLLIAALLLIAAPASAATLLNTDRCNIAEDEVITDDLFVLCGSLTISGRVEGHVIGAARSVWISGEVTGNVYVLAGEIDVAGKVDDVHFAGVALRVLPEADFGDSGSLLAANLSSTIQPEAAVSGSLINIGYQLLIEGEVGRRVSFWGSALQIDGQVRGNVDATVGDNRSDGVSDEIETLLIPFPFDVQLVDPGLIVRDSAQIAGRLNYTAPNEGIIAGQIAGATTFTSNAQPIAFITPEHTLTSLQIYLRRAFRSFITLGFIGAVGLLIAPRWLHGPLRPLQTRPLSTLGVGLLSFILSFPIVLATFVFSLLIVVLLSAFILPILPLNEIVLVGGAVLGLANIGGASLFYFVAIYVARVIVALAIGRAIFRMIGREGASPREIALSLAAGLLILALAGATPVIGVAFDALALFLGLGAILIVVRAQFVRLWEAGGSRYAERVSERAGEQPALPYFPEEVDALAAAVDDPADDDRAVDLPVSTPAPQPVPRGPGMDNLPPGFRWWE